MVTHLHPGHTQYKQPWYSALLKRRAWQLAFQIMALHSNTLIRIRTSQAWKSSLYGAPISCEDTCPPAWQVNGGCKHAIYMSASTRRAMHAGQQTPRMDRISAANCSNALRRPLYPGARSVAHYT